MIEQQSKALTPIGEICTGLEKMKDKLQMALPKGVTVDKFYRTAVQGIQTHRDKDKLASANRSSFYLAVQRAASDGLMLDGREAVLVVFGQEVQFMPMVQGLIKLARNSGEIKNIEAQVVFKNDKFSYIMGQDESPRHEADWFGERGEPVGAWAVITLNSGEKIPAILSKSKIMRVAGKSKNGYQYDPSKGDAWEEWWKKTAIKNVLKYAPRSTELDRALEADDEATVVIDQTPVVVEDQPIVEQEQPKKKRAVDKVKEAVEKEITVEAEYEEVPI